MVFICFTNHATVVEPKVAKYSISHGNRNFVEGLLEITPYTSYTHDFFLYYRIHLRLRNQIALNATATKVLTALP